MPRGRCAVRWRRGQVRCGAEGADAGGGGGSEGGLGGFVWFPLDFGEYAGVPPPGAGACVSSFGWVGR